MSNVIPILQLKLELERKLHESKPPASQGYSMEEKLQRLKERRQGTDEFQDAFVAKFSGKPPSDFIEMDVEPQQAEHPDPIHFELNGLPISIENQAGTVRSDIDSDGHKWSIQLQDHYGEIRGSIGADGDYVDCFINPDYIPDEQGINSPVFVINQNNPHTGEFDEVKAMLGYNSIEEAEQAYLRNYEDGWQGLGEIHECSYPEFERWLQGDTTEEFEE
jgi:Inorganic Pyrophosphatase